MNIYMKKRPHSVYINSILYHQIMDLPLKNKKTFSKRAGYILQQYINKQSDDYGHNKTTHNSNNNNKLKFIDLFAGVGGIRLGFDDYKRDKDTECVFSSEWDRFAQKTYKANFGVTPAGDITKVHDYQIPYFDVMLAGFPCQPFSTIGKRQGFANKTQGTLFFDVLRIIHSHKPKAFLLENVPGLLTIQHGQTISIIKGALEHEGYNVDYHVLQASRFGLAQSRRRVIIVGFRKDIDCSNFAFPSHNNKPKVFVKDILEHDDPKGYSTSKRLQEHYLFKENDGHPYVVNLHTKALAKTLNASYHKIQRVTGTFVQIDKNNPHDVRLLSKKECERLQGFAPTPHIPKNDNACPANFKFKMPVSRTQMYKQMGNAVAIPMIQAVAHNMKAVLRHEPTKNQYKNASVKQLSL